MVVRENEEQAVVARRTSLAASNAGAMILGFAVTDSRVYNYITVMLPSGNIGRWVRTVPRLNQWQTHRFCRGRPNIPTYNSYCRKHLQIETSKITPPTPAGNQLNPLYRCGAHLVFQILVTPFTKKILVTPPSPACFSISAGSQLLAESVPSYLRRRDLQRRIRDLASTTVEGSGGGRSSCCTACRRRHVPLLLPMRPSPATLTCSRSASRPAHAQRAGASASAPRHSGPAPLPPAPCALATGPSLLPCLSSPAPAARRSAHAGRSRRLRPRRLRRDRRA
jgi:hypothetical protein